MSLANRDAVMFAAEGSRDFTASAEAGAELFLIEIWRC